MQRPAYGFPRRQSAETLKRAPDRDLCSLSSRQREAKRVSRVSRTLLGLAEPHARPHSTLTQVETVLAQDSFCSTTSLVTPAPLKHFLFEVGTRERILGIAH